MTEEERKMLDEVHAMIKDLKRDLYELPDASLPGEEPFMIGARKVIRAYNRASWLTRGLIWLLPTGAAIGGAIAAIYNWIPKQP